MKKRFSPEYNYDVVRENYKVKRNEGENHVNIKKEL